MKTRDTKWTMRKEAENVDRIEICEQTPGRRKAKGIENKKGLDTL